MRDEPTARHLLAGRIRLLRDRVAEEVTEDFLRRNPDFVARYGERARRFGIEDARFHADFLAGALECGEPGRFADYARWTARVLRSRGIAAEHLAANLQQLGAALEPHFDAPEGSYLRAILQEGIAAASEEPRPAAAPKESPLGLAGEVFLQAILNGRRQAACNILLEALRTGHSLAEIYVEVVQTAMYQVGVLWESNRISVATEHMATAIAQFAMAQIYPLLPPAAERRGRAVVTGVEGELHQIGANMVADLLEANGWNVQFLGTNLPHGGILAAVEEHQAELVGISATMLFNVPQVRRLVADIRTLGPTRPLRILVGGGAFRSLANPAETVGADGFGADLDSVMNLAGA